jgi:hypothetical protein
VKVSVLAILITLAVSGSGAAVYYVAPPGNDTNPGTFERPWCTIGKAARSLVAGDSVLIRAGVYPEAVNPANSGTPGTPITYARYDGEEVIVEGNQEVTGWTPDSGNRWQAVVNFTVDPRFTSSRDPNGNHGGLVLQDSAKLRYAMSPSRAAVDSPGEYYMNDSFGPPCTLCVYVRDLGRGLDPNEYRMSIGRRRKGFDLDGGADWLVVDGLTFRNCNDNAIHSIGSTDCVFRHLTLYSSFITGIYLTSNSNRCRIEHCAFWDNGHGGIELASSCRALVWKNRFLRRDRGDGFGGNGAHMWLGPVGALADSNLVENNLAFETGRQGYAGPGFAVAGSYNILRHNSMAGGRGGALALLDGGHNTIVNNAFDVSAAVAHGIAVFPAAVLDSGHLIRGNDFYAQDPTGKYWWNNVRYNSVAAWESASAQTGNFDSLPGFVDPDNEDLHLGLGSPCIDHGTPDSAATEDFDGVSRPQGGGFDIGASEYVPTALAEIPDSIMRHVTRTIVRGVLRISSRLTACGSRPGIELLDAAGRRVMRLEPGENDVSWLAAGVYFVRGKGAGNRGRGEVRKVVIQH